MKKNHLRRFLTFYLIISVVMLGVFVQPAKAQSNQAFSISPPLVELKADPGQTVTASIKLTNVSDSTLRIQSHFNDFGAKDETGEPNIIFEESHTTVYSLRQWIASPEPFTIAPQETKTVDFLITVPHNAEPGGHYAVIRFSGSTPELEQNGVALTASIGSLVLLKVSGAINEKASITEFFTATQKFAQNNIFESGPITFVERIKNDGNVHLKPTGNIDIFNAFGQQVASLPVNGDPRDTNNPPRSVLPNSIRRFDQTWDSGFTLGYYRARVELTYGQDSKPLFATAVFWVIPYKTIGLGLLILIVLFFGGRFGLKKYNHYIIKKAGGRSGGLG